MRKTLLPFTARQVANSRRALKRLDLDPEGFTTVHMYTLKKVLQRLPRHVTTLTEQRYVRRGMGRRHRCTVWYGTVRYGTGVRYGMVMIFEREYHVNREGRGSCRIRGTVLNGMGREEQQYFVTEMSETGSGGTDSSIFVAKWRARRGCACGLQHQRLVLCWPYFQWWPHPSFLSSALPSTPRQAGPP